MSDPTPKVDAVPQKTFIVDGVEVDGNGKPASGGKPDYSARRAALEAQVKELVELEAREEEARKVQDAADKVAADKAAADKALADKALDATQSKTSPDKSKAALV